MITRLLFFLLSFVIITSAVHAQKKLWYADDFTAAMDTAKWIAEMAPAADSGVYVQNGRLILNTRGGVTVWFKKPLHGNFRIEYDRIVIMNNGEHDRLSDMNQFWLANDPRNPNLFTRNGVFEAYDSLRMFYVGMGGNYNSTNRFRFYEGDGRKTLLQERNDSSLLLRANKRYHIVIEVRNGTTRFSINGKVLFSCKDRQLPHSGYFGFRSTWSRQEISRFRVYRL